MERPKKALGYVGIYVTYDCDKDFQGLSVVSQIDFIVDAVHPAT